MRSTTSAPRPERLGSAITTSAGIASQRPTSPRVIATSSAARLWRASLTAAGLPSIAITCRPRRATTPEKSPTPAYRSTTVSAVVGDRGGHDLGEGVDAVGAALEERRRRDAPAPARRELRVHRVPAPLDLVGADGHDVGRQREVARRRVRDHEPLPRPRATAELGLGHAVEAGGADQVVDERVGHDARVDGHRVVGSRPAERGPTLAHQDPHRRAEVGVGEDHRLGHERLGARDLAEPRERVDDDVAPQATLRRRRDVLPLAAAAPVEHVPARWRGAVGGRLEHLEHAAASEGLLRGRDLDPDRLPGDRALDHHHPPVGVPGERLTPGDHLLRGELDVGHVALTGPTACT